MHVLIAIALKSVLIAGLTLGLLQLMKRRSAAERSWVAHIGLLALVIMACAPIVLPTWNVEAPALLGRDSIEATVQTAQPVDTVFATVPARDVPKVSVPPKPSLSAGAAATALYALPAAILLLITFLAIARLIALRARADVLIDGHWLSALAKAQRRMGFKHGTALLTSNELSSPISWGLFRPVILLNDRAVAAPGEAEAIIAHELAHVARMDWFKLLLARVATALFWFNPFVWMLAREAHQLREEAADDAVLGADVIDTDYAQLLVGVARHECPGLLLGAHGVAPSKSSLARRVARVLDGASARGPVARSFVLGVLVGAILIAAPLAALTLTPGGSPKRTADSAATATSEKAHFVANETPADLPHIIAKGVTASVASVTAAVSADTAKEARLEAAKAALEAGGAVGKAEAQREAGIAAAKEALANAHQARTEALADASDAVRQARNSVRVEALSSGRIDAVIEMRAAGVDADYVNALRAAQPRLRSLEPSDFAGLKAVGVTPEYARGLAAAGFNNLDADDLSEVRAIGLTPEYARGMAAAGVPLRVDDYVELRTVGVPVQYVQSIRRSGYSVGDADKIIRMWTVGVHPNDLKVGRVPAPTPPRPPRAPDPDDGPDSGDG